MHRLNTKIPATKKILLLMCFVLVFSMLTPLTNNKANAALSEEQKKLFNTGVLYYDKGFNNDCVLPSTTQSNSTVYVIGDSIAEGLNQNSLSKKLKDNGYTDIKFNAVSGRSITGGGDKDYPALKAIKDDADYIKKAGTVLVVLGTNPESSFESNLRAFLKELNSTNGGARKFWVNVGVTKAELQQNMNTVNKALNDNSGEFDYKVVDWAAKVKANKSLMSGDRIHPTATGYTVLTNLVADSFGKIETTTTSIKTDGSEEKNKLVIWTYLVGKGLTPQQAAGIMGNMQAESGFEPGRVQYGSLNSRGEVSVQDQPSSFDNNVPTHSGGYGLVQWTWPPFKDDLRNFAKQRGVPASDLQMQLDFLWKQLTGDQSFVLNEIKRTTNVKDAMEVFLKKFEKPCAGQPNEASCYEEKSKDRLPFAEQILKKYAGISGTTSGCSNALTAGGLGWDLEGPNKMVYYSQTDPKWANQKYGNCSSDPTISSSGCGPTSIAMIISTLVGNGVTPPEIAKISVDNGFRTCGVGTDHGLGAFVANKYNLKYSNIGTDFDKAVEILKKGGLVWVSVGEGTFTSSGHLMVIRKTTEDGQSFYLADPISEAGRTNGESNTKAYTRDELLTSGNLSNMYGFTK